MGRPQRNLAALHNASFLICIFAESMTRLSFGAHQASTSRTIRFIEIQFQNTKCWSPSLAGKLFCWKTLSDPLRRERKPASLTSSWASVAPVWNKAYRVSQSNVQTQQEKKKIHFNFSSFHQIYPNLSRLGTPVLCVHGLGLGTLCSVWKLCMTDSSLLLLCWLKPRETNCRTRLCSPDQPRGAHGWLAGSTHSPRLAVLACAALHSCCHCICYSRYLWILPCPWFWLLTVVNKPLKPCARWGAPEEAFSCFSALLMVAGTLKLSPTGGGVRLNICLLKKIVYK